MAPATTAPARSASVLRGLLTGTLVVVVALLAGCTGDRGADPTPTGPRVLRVPADHTTIQQAVDAARPGDLVLVAPGTYTEQVVLGTDDVTVRGEDRDAVVVDGEGVRPSGIVATADGDRIENLTVRNTTFYGVLVTGLRDEDGQPSAHGVDGYETLDPERNPPVQRFAVSHVTATNNGLYGVYAFDAQHGVISDVYASGSADSGIYVGQCRACDILVRDSVAERNAVGFENANASDSVLLVGNRFSGNRIGATFLSNYQEAFAPQQASTVVGNVIVDNTSAQSPAQADGGFGIGIGVSGARDNVFRANVVAGNPYAGVLLTNTEDLPAADNVFADTRFAVDGLPPNGIDVANVSADRTPATGNCWTGSTPDPTVLPATLGGPCGDPAAQDATGAGMLPPVQVPPGLSFLQVPGPVPQPGMQDVTTIPGPLPPTVTMPDVTRWPVPDADLLADRSALS